MKKIWDTKFADKTISPPVTILKYKKKKSHKQPRQQKKQSVLDISRITVSNLDYKIANFASKSNDIPTTTLTMNNQSSLLCNDQAYLESKINLQHALVQISLQIR